MGFFKALMSILIKLRTSDNKRQILLLALFVSFAAFVYVDDKTQKVNEKMKDLVQQMTESKLEVDIERGGRYTPSSVTLTFLESNNSGFKNKRVLGKLKCGENTVKCYSLILANKDEIIKTGSPDKILDFEN